jgi:hypothetical protein
MKSKMNLSVSTAIWLIILGPGIIMAQELPLGGRPGLMASPDPRQPERSVLLGQKVIAPQPAKPSGEKWIDEDWADPGITLKELRYDNLPVSEIANNLRELFKNSVDILIAQKASDEGVDPATWTAKFGLHDVKASEVFRAMNELLEAENSPLRWRLKMNGSRPMALFCVAPELESPPLPGGAIDPTTGLPVPMRVNQKKPMVFFVGDLIGDEKEGGLTWDHFQNMLTDIEFRTYKQDFVIGFHKDAQLLIVKGTDEQITFMRQTLQALKARMETEGAKHPPSNPFDKPADPKAVSKPAGN